MDTLSALRLSLCLMRMILRRWYASPSLSGIPGNGNWSVKWVQRIEVTAAPPDCWYHWRFYYYGTSADDPHRELITTIGVRTLQ